MEKHKLFKILRYICFGVSLMLLVMLIIQICFLKESYLAVYISELSASIVLDLGGFTLNLCYIKKVETINNEKVNLFEVKKNETININKIENASFGNAVIKLNENPDWPIVKMLIKYFHEFEKSVENGYFSLEGSFCLEQLTPLTKLKEELNTASIICKDEKLGQGIKVFRKNLNVFLTNVNLHSFGIETIGYNKMRWIDIEEEQILGISNFSEKKIEQEKTAYENAQEALNECIEIYKNIISDYKKRLA